MLETPIKSNKCAVVIPTYKNNYTESEHTCLTSALNSLNNWDIYFATHSEKSLQPFSNENGLYKTSLFEKKIFNSVESYSNWLLTEDLYKRFGLYKKILICQSDVFINADEVEYWVSKDYDYIGAPWHGLVSITPQYASTPNINGISFNLFVGNGGFSMRDTRGSIEALKRNDSLLKEFNGNEDGLFGFLGLIDPQFKLAPYHDACLFSLELLAKETIGKTKKIPMGFHALEKHDPLMWSLITQKIIE